MSDNRNQGRQNTYDTGSPQSRPRDDLRTANKKKKPNESRDEKRDKEGKTEGENESQSEAD